MHALAPSPAHLPIIRRWLSLAIALVMLMVVIGGVTRLTESGLSIVEWKLLSGTLPPMNDAAWSQEFDAYKTSPQFKQVNSDFSVSDFKRIYWLEYVHRLLGRVIGLVIVLGTVYFSLRRYLPKKLMGRMALISLLVAAQGTVGWIMVASGLQHEPRVAPIKLAAHLLLAVSLYMALLWTRWQVLGHARLSAPRGVVKASRGLLVLVLVQLGLGALVAGLRAGLSYNTYPLMDGQLIPDGLYLLEPWWRNHLESVVTVQFQHRMGALLVLFSTVGFVAYSWNKVAIRPALKVLLIAVFVQFCLGVATLLSGVKIDLAAAHQLFALWLTGILLRVIYRTTVKTD